MDLSRSLSPKLNRQTLDKYPSHKRRVNPCLQVANRSHNRSHNRKPLERNQGNLEIQSRVLEHKLHCRPSLIQSLCPPISHGCFRLLISLPAGLVEARLVQQIQRRPERLPLVQLPQMRTQPLRPPHPPPLIQTRQVQMDPPTRQSSCKLRLIWSLGPGRRWSEVDSHLLDLKARLRLKPLLHLRPLLLPARRRTLVRHRQHRPRAEQLTRKCL